MAAAVGDCGHCLADCTGSVAALGGLERDCVVTVAALWGLVGATVAGTVGGGED